jgi:hypothetical protein
LKKINIRPTLVRTHWCAAESPASLPLSLTWGANSLWADVPLCSEKEKEKKKALINDLNPLTKPEIKKGSELSIKIKIMYPTDKQGSIRHFPASVTVHSPVFFFQFLHGVSMASIPWNQILT